MALELPRGECSRMDGKAGAEVIERAEARETLTRALEKEIVDKPVTALTGRRGCGAPVTSLIHVVGRGADPSKEQVRNGSRADFATTLAARPVYPR
jgi:hypothetical protein